MKQLWRDLRAALRTAAVQAVLRVVVGLLAALGAADAVSPDPVAPEIAGAVAEAVRQ